MDFHRIFHIFPVPGGRRGKVRTNKKHFVKCKTRFQSENRKKGLEFNRTEVPGESDQNLEKWN